MDAIKGTGVSGRTGVSRIGDQNSARRIATGDDKARERRQADEASQNRKAAAESMQKRSSDSNSRIGGKVDLRA